MINSPLYRSSGFDGQRAGSLALDSSDDPNQTSIVVDAARSGSGDMIDAVVAVMSELMPEQKVRVMLEQSTGGNRGRGVCGVEEVEPREIRKTSCPFLTFVTAYRLCLRTNVAVGPHTPQHAPTTLRSLHASLSSYLPPFRAPFPALTTCVACFLSILHTHVIANCC